MKFICTQENLKYGLSLVSPISSKNVNLPILNNIFIEAKDNIIKLIATNLETAIICTIRGKVEINGVYTIPSKLFSDYILLLPKEKIELTLQKETDTGSEILHIQCKNYKTKIKGLPASEYPIIPKLDTNISYSCSLEDLDKALSQILFAVSQNESRPELCGVLMNISESFLTLAATDSYRLAEKIVPVKSKTPSTEGSGQRVIVPARALHELSKILHTAASLSDIENIEDLQICFTESQIMFIVGSVELTSRLIEGQYPDYKQIIPREFQTTAETQTQECVQIIKSASLFARNGIFDVSFRMNTETQELIVSSGNTQVGENTCKMASTIQGKENYISLNYRYVLEGLQNIPTPEFYFQVINDSSPCLIKPQGQDGYMYIIMPIKQ